MIRGSERCPHCSKQRGWHVFPSALNHTEEISDVDRIVSSPFHCKFRNTVGAQARRLMKYTGDAAMDRCSRLKAGATTGARGERTLECLAEAEWRLNERDGRSCVEVESRDGVVTVGSCRAGLGAVAFVWRVYIADWMSESGWIGCCRRSCASNRKKHLNCTNNITQTS